MGRLTTELGADVLVLMRFEGHDRLSALFDYTVDCLSVQPDIDFDSVIGTHASVILRERDGGEKPFDGIVTEARWLGAGENGHRYRLSLKPWFYLATLRRNQRIFHNKTVVQILEELLAEYSGAGKLEVKLTAQYPVLEYTVQYRESDFAFAARLMERFGISYHFKHDERMHTMVLTDAVEEHDTIGMRPYKPYDGHHQEEVEHFWEWRPARRITTGAIRLTDYNFKTPVAAMKTELAGDAAHAHGQIESFDYPGDYLDKGRGKVVAGLRVHQERGQDPRIEARGDIPALAAGVRVTLGGDPAPGGGEEYVCLSAQHSFVSDSYGTGGQQSDGYAYSGRYLLMPASAPLAPEKKTPQARVEGPQTAVVVGDGEIDCDEYGRILVQFHWDLDAAYSMRCRVAQNWSGGGWGGMVIPRIGMEVLVEFLEGDPDKPLVTGCVFNGKNQVPYPLPAHKTKSVFRTDTHQESGFNEIVFEDEKGMENIALQAQQDFTQLVLNDRIGRLKRHDVLSVGENQVVEIGNNQKTEVGKSVTTVVGGTAAGALGLFASLAGLAGKTGSLIKKGGKEAGSSDPTIGGFAGTVGQTALGFLSGQGLSARGGVVGASEAGLDANHALRQSGSELGESGNGLFTLPGVMNTMVSNFRSDTTGVSAVEQVGLSKVVNVGASSMEQVGKAKTVTIGEKLKTMVGKTIFTRTKKHTLLATEKFTIAGPGGSITIDSGGITIKAIKLKILSPSVDFNAGAPAQQEALKGEEAFAQKCQGSAKG